MSGMGDPTVDLHGQEHASLQDDAVDDELLGALAMADCSCVPDLVANANEQLSQPSGTHAQQELPCNGEMASEKSAPKEVIALHNEMVDKVSDELGPDCPQDWNRLLSMFKDNPITKTEKARIKNMMDLFDILMSYDEIGYGDYSKFTDKLDRINRRMITMVKKYTENMNRVMHTCKGNRNVTCKIEAREDAVMSLGDSTVQEMTETDWQHCLDVVAGHLPNDINGVADYLDISSDKQSEIERDNNTQHEISFHILWEWYRRKVEKSDTAKAQQLVDALERKGRRDVIQMKFPLRTDYIYTGSITSPEMSVTEVDLTRVSEMVVAQFPSLVRYFRLGEDAIYASKHNNVDVQKQARDALQKCLNIRLLKTRQNLCSGLCYIDRKDIIGKLDALWA